MPTAQPMIRLQLKGHIQSFQTWSISLWMRLVQPTDLISQATLDNVSGNWSTYAQTFASSIQTSCWGSGTQCDSIEASWYGTHTDRPSLVSLRSFVAISGTGSALMPAYVAMVTSLRSSNPSRAGRGRFYLPVTLATACSSSANQFGSGATGVVNGAAKTLIDSLNAMTTPAEITSHRVAVRSASSNAALDVVRIVTDSVPDHQSRRGNKFLASSVYAAVPA